MKSLTTELENRVKKEGFIKKETLTNDEWKQLWIAENPGTSKIEEIFGQKYKTIYNYITSKIGIYRSFMDEEFIFKLLLQIRVNSHSTDSVTKYFFSTILLNKIAEIYKRENGKYVKLYDIEELWNQQQKILEYNQNDEEYIENFIDEYLYKLYLKIKENNFSYWMFEPYYMDPEELNNMKIEFLDMIENNNFLEVRKSFLHYEDIFVDSEEIELEEFMGNTIKHIKGKKNNNKVKIDYEIAHRNQKEVGDSGEEEVLKILIKRFKDNKNLLKQIEHVSKEDDSKGYDISYVDEEGHKNYIEVKTNSNKNDNRFTFFISRNEDEFLRNNKRASIYYVKLHPKLKITKITREKYLEMEKEPITYLVDVECL